MTPVEAFSHLRTNPGAFTLYVHVKTKDVKGLPADKAGDLITLLLFEHMYRIDVVTDQEVVCQLSFNRQWREVRFPIGSILRIFVDYPQKPPVREERKPQGQVVSLADYRKRRQD